MHTKSKWVAIGLSALAPVVAQGQTPSLRTKCIRQGPPPEHGYDSYARAQASRSETVIGDVPMYKWRYGCTPTSAGMVIGYWDGQGFDALIPGDASTQTPAVNEAIANDLHYNDYTLPLDYYPNLKRDKSEQPIGDEHESNCIADFMKTSWSVLNLYYGHSWVSNSPGALLAYTDYVNRTYGAHYKATSSVDNQFTFTWERYVLEIDSGQPLILHVDIDGDGDTDHSVCGVGYRPDTNGDGLPEYGFLDTGGPPDALRWEQFQLIGVGNRWGISAVTYYTIRAVACDDGTCDEDEDPCNCPADCGMPAAAEIPNDTCTDDLDNDCDGYRDCDDSDCATDPVCVCDGDGTCEPGEDCNACPTDCLRGTGAVCGNNICEVAEGEDCLSCPDDCNGNQTGNPGDRFCCGDGDGENPITCADPICHAGGNACSNEPVVGSCCGDEVCEGEENLTNCEIDCYSPVICGNGLCEGTENPCNCPDDCGTPQPGETDCADGIDNDCDGSTDCDDDECSADPACYNPCGDGFCDVDEDLCTCPEDCGTPTLFESECDDGIDNDCDTRIDCDDHDCDTDPVCGCTPKGGPCTSPFDCCSGLCSVKRWVCK